jgi:hypothetical protein
MAPNSIPQLALIQVCLLLSCTDADEAWSATVMAIPPLAEKLSELINKPLRWINPCRHHEMNLQACCGPESPRRRCFAFSSQPHSALLARLILLNTHSAAERTIFVKLRRRI